MLSQADYLLLLYSNTDVCEQIKRRASKENSYIVFTLVIRYKYRASLHLVFYHDKIEDIIV